MLRAAEFGQHGGVLLEAARRRLSTRAVATVGLNRFAVAQVLSGAADALVAVSLAGSLFFSLSPEASQQQVLFYLLINMAPYVLLAPLIGPAIDRLRYGPRGLAIALFAVRAACAIGLAFSLLDLGLYFFALALLIAAKATGISRQALMPGLVDDPSHLVAANSRLARLNVVAGLAGGAVGAGILVISTPTIAAALAGLLFLGSAIATVAIPDPGPDVEVVAPSVAYEELHRPTIVATSWAFTVVRASVGFFVFGLAFALRRESEPAWMYAATVALYGAGSFAGNVAAPLLRRRHGEDRLTAGALVMLAVVVAFGALGPSRPLVLLVAVVLGGAAAIARQGFDALVQTWAPTASHGRTFARFETRFQLAWVAGAIAATAVGIPIQISLAVVAIGLIPAAVLYVRSLQEGSRAHVNDPFNPVAVARRRLDHAREWHRRELDRLAATELFGVVDLARASGMPLSAETVAHMERLRRVALSTSPVDREDVWWALGKAGELVDRMERREMPADARHEPSTGTTEDEVMVQRDDRSSKVKIALDQSSSDR